MNKIKKDKYLLKLYLNKSGISVDIIKELKTALKGTDYRIEIIDVTKEPNKAEKDNVLVTPTLIKELPPPLRRIVGDLADREKILAGLDVL